MSMADYKEEDEEILKEEIRSVETEDLEISNVSSLLADQSTVKEESRMGPRPIHELVAGSLNPTHPSVSGSKSINGHVRT